MPETINRLNAPQQVARFSPRAATSIMQPICDVVDENVVRTSQSSPPSPPCAVASPYLLTEADMQARNVPEGLISTYSRFYYQSCFGLSTWYPLLQQYTTETEFLQLSDQEIDAIYERCCASHAVTDNLAVDDGATLAPELRQAWLALKKRIDAAINKFPEGVFVRLDTRSTKDAPMNMINVTRVRKQILAAVESAQHSTNSVVLDPKQALDTFMEAQANAMRASTVDEVLTMIRYSNQVREDLATLRRLRGLGISCFLTLRKWNQELATHNECEFRAFVHNNDLTAITQYNQSVFNRDLLTNKQQIGDMLSTFLKETVIPAVPHRTFIVDLFISPTTHQISIVGFNPFEVTTAASLFDWKRDAPTLLNGPFLFRVLENPPAAMFDKKKGRCEDVAMEVIPPKWARVLQADLGCLRYDERFVHPTLDASGVPFRSRSYAHMNVHAPSVATQLDTTTVRDVAHAATDRTGANGMAVSALPMSRSAHASVGGGAPVPHARRHSAPAVPPVRADRSDKSKKTSCIIC